MRANILIIDDEPDMLELVSFHVRAAGHKVLQAATGKAGLHSAQSNLPDLIILDVMLPDLEGFTICEMLRRLPSTASTPVLMLTALDGELARAHAIGCGVTGYLRKPCNMAKLVEQIDQTLREEEARRAQAQAAFEVEAALEPRRARGL